MDPQGMPRETPPQTGIDRMGVPFAARDIRSSTIIKHGDLFLLADLAGNVPCGSPSGFGLYYGDTRFLSGYELVVEGLRPTILLAVAHTYFLGAHVLTNPSLVIDDRFVPEQTVQVRRYRAVRSAGLSESLRFENYNGFPVVLCVGFRVEADFADVFRVRGLVLDGEPPEPVEATYGHGELSFAYEGADGVRRVTDVRFDPEPESARGRDLSYRIELPARGTRRIAVTVDLLQGASGGAAPPVPVPNVASPDSAHWLSGTTRVETSNGSFDALLAQTRTDLRMLLGAHDGLPFIAAGVPWYGTLFGRDSLITALLEVWLCPALARHTLRALARLQGRRDDAWRDEEPGKIPHELRRGELSACGAVPFTPYYGTIDATPLWVMLLGAYHRATGDLGLVRELYQNLDAALTWMDRQSDVDVDGFVAYRSRSRQGLSNQGWKDSWDGIVHADGTWPEAPIALVEVQAYVYSARLRAASLMAALGDPARAAALRASAERLRTAFEAAFWMPEKGTYCLGLDGAKTRIASVTSNAGHALWCGIAARGRAKRVAETLMAEDMFSGWGVRTLSSREIAYNPTGYHVGTVWPHDNALVALGLKRYREEQLAGMIATGLFEAALGFPSLRMPELFCGFDRSAYAVPVRYPVACSPQAWAASAWSGMLQMMLGVVPDAPRRELRIVRPCLPEWLRTVRISGLKVGGEPGGEVDLRYERIGDHTAVDVVSMRGDIRVTLGGDWDDEGELARPE